MSNAKMQLLYYKKHIKDPKHHIEFEKDKIFYKGHTFDAIISKELRAHLDKIMQEKGLQFPLLLEIPTENTEKYYFTKSKAYDYTNKSTGVVERKLKTQIALLKVDAVLQGEFSGGKSLDDVIAEIDGLEEE